LITTPAYYHKTIRHRVNNCNISNKFLEKVSVLTGRPKRNIVFTKLQN
jgi:hypothetical protein